MRKGGKQRKELSRVLLAMRAARCLVSETKERRESAVGWDPEPHTHI